MISPRLRPLLLILAVFTAVSIGLAMPARAADQPAKVLVLPFKMNAQQDMTFLQQGIQDMLVSRLSWENKVLVLPKGQARQVFDQFKGVVDESVAKKLASDLGADYVMFGSVTVLGQSVSLDAKMLDAKGQAAPISAFAQSPNMDGVIPRVNQFAEEVNAKVFGRGTVAAAPAAAPAEQEELPTYRRHPDYLLTGREGQTLSPLNPNFLSVPGAMNDQGFWRSPTLPIVITGLVMGDVDGDGRSEMVYTSRNSVYVARIEQDSFTRVAKYDGKTTDNFVTVDLADVNGNGVPEIFISNQQRFDAKSLVLEMRDGQLAIVEKDMPYYLRVVDMPSGRRLLGQRSGIGELFYGGIFEMGFSKGKYTQMTPVNLPGFINVLNFSLADLTGSGLENLVYIDHREMMVVSSRGGQRQWRGQDYFANTMNYLQAPAGRMGSSNQIDEAPEKYYVPARLLITDLDEDGKKEMIVAKNEFSYTPMFERLRSFERGNIQSLGFSQMAVRQNWHSRDLPGTLVDYQINDYNNDGKRDLVVAVNVSTGEGLSDARSNIVAYELASPEEMKKAAETQDK